MKKKNLIIKNSFHKSDFNKKFIRDFENIKKEIFKSTHDTKKIWNIFSENFKINFKTKDLVKFKKFKNIVVIGMGGSMLGTESIYYFLKKKIKKNFFFLSDLDADKINDLKKKVFVVAGGVAANKRIRSILINLCNEENYQSLFPPIEFCGDNAAMIAMVGLEKFKLKQFDNLDHPAKPRWPLDENAAFLKGAGVQL